MYRAIASRLHRLHPRREMLVAGALVLAVAGGLGGLAGGWVLYRTDRDWAPVATVNGHTISREALRGRLAALDFLAAERSSFLSEAGNAGLLSKSQVTALQQQAASSGTPEAARESLINDELLRELAARDGISTPASPDLWAEATDYGSGDVARQVRYIRFGLLSPTASTGSAPPSWPVASESNVDATVAKVRAELTASTSVESLSAALRQAGWQVTGEDVAVATDGSAADPNLDMDPSISAAATLGEAGDILGPSVDAAGRISLGKLLPSADRTQLERMVPFDADKAKLDTGALQAWADGQGLRRAVLSTLLAQWRKGVNQAHFREIVIGPSPDSSGTLGPWVELSALVVDRLTGLSSGSVANAPANLSLTADALAKTLNSTSGAGREALFRSLVAAANQQPSLTTANTSGELGFKTKDGLIPEIGSVAFDTATQTGQVIGPISTSAGPELFLIESRYAGPLDDRSQAALRQIRTDPAPDPATYTRLYSPGDIGLANDAGWRAEPEFGSSEAVRAALFDTPIGSISDPFLLDGKLALAIVTERKTDTPDSKTMDRLVLDGYNAWFASEYSKATITRADVLLPELVTPKPSVAPSESAVPEMPSPPALDTPNLPAIPGQGTSEPGSTDAFGQPAQP